MKRSIKNIIMIVLLFITCGALLFTIYSLNNESSNTTIPNGNENGFEKPNDNQIDSSGNLEESDTNKPSDMNSLEKPDELSNSDETNKPDELSNSDEANKPDNLNKPDDIGGNMPSFNETKISNLYYLAFTIEGLVLASIVIYLIMSNFNKKTLKETFITKDKIIIYLLSITLFTILIVYMSTKINISKVEKSNTDVTYESALEIDEETTITSGSYTSENSDENAISVDGVSASISNIEVNKTGDSSTGDESNFYGTNSAILAKNGANLVLDNVTIKTTSSGANGVFSYGGSATTNNSTSDGTTVTISNSTITTTGDNAGGIMTTGGGITNASNLTINTSGTSSAAIRSDRGGGTVNVDGGIYQTTGKGSPAIYSTATINVTNADLISKTSEGIVIEGKNSVTIENTTLTDSNTELNGKSTTYKNIFLYQSMSGDASDGTASFKAINSTITTNNGDTLYVTNTSAVIDLINNTIINNDSNGNFLRIQKDSWGTTNENGGDVTLNLTNQNITGNIVVDEISTLSVNLTSSSYEGIINQENTALEISVKLDSNSKIKLTGDSYITSLEDEDTSYSNIDFNGYKLYVNDVAIN